MAVSNENGVKEAIGTLKEQTKELFVRIHDLEINGCAASRVHEDKIEDIKEQVKEMKNEINGIRSRLDRWNGAIALLVVIVPVIIKIFWR